MATRRAGPGAPGVKEEASGGDYAFTSGWQWDFERASDDKARLKETARKLAAEAGFDSPRTRGRLDTDPDAMMPAKSDARLSANKDGGAQVRQLQAKTPKYSGKASWEAFHAQFELLARAAGWTEDDKALQLALCLTDEALSCLLLLSPAERDEYGALVGALQRRFGQCNQQSVLRIELSSRRRQDGEPLRLLANDIETLARRAYAHMPTDVQSELARDQFIQAITPRELRVQTLLAHPRTLQEALELALEREIVGAGSTGIDQARDGPVVRVAARDGLEQERPAWLDEVSELIRAASLRSPQGSGHPRRASFVCWECGQAGHIRRHCPRLGGSQGNAPGSV